MTAEDAAPWRFFAHDGCPLCEMAARRLFDLFRGLPATIRIQAVAQGGGPHVRDVPRLEDPGRAMVWEGSVDDAATRRAWADARRRGIHERPSATPARLWARRRRRPLL